MARSKRRRVYKLTNAVERVDEDVRGILSRGQSTRYFEGIVMMYSLIENILKWLVFIKIVWGKCDRVIPARELESLKQFCNQQDFYSTLHLALVTDLIKHPLFRRIDKIRMERNDVVHQCYLFTHRRNRRVLRAKLLRLAAMADDLFVIFRDLIEETGADDSYDIFKVRRKKQMLT
jgi:hypothetical protein